MLSTSDPGGDRIPPLATVFAHRPDSGKSPQKQLTNGCGGMTRTRLPRRHTAAINGSACSSPTAQFCARYSTARTTIAWWREAKLSSTARRSRLVALSTRLAASGATPGDAPGFYSPILNNGSLPTPCAVGPPAARAPGSARPSRRPSAAHRMRRKSRPRQPERKGPVITKPSAHPSHHLQALAKTMNASGAAGSPCLRRAARVVQSADPALTTGSPYCCDKNSCLYCVEFAAGMQHHCRVPEPWIRADRAATRGPRIRANV